jgi:hypothetical protein
MRPRRAAPARDGMVTLMVVACVYDADLYCPDCIVQQLGQPPIADVAGAVEEALDDIAGALGFDRDDETGFDSGTFPKVAFAEQVRSAADYPLRDDDGGETADRCGHCHRVLVGED